MKHIMTWALGALLAVGVAVSVSTPAQAEQEIIFGISAKPGSLQQLTAAEFTKRANEKLGGKAVVKLFDSQQLGKDKEMMQKLKLGSIHITLPSSIMSSIAGEFGVFDMPFLIADRDQVKRIQDNMLGAKLSPAAAAQGYEVLAMWENGVRHITNNERPINTPGRSGRAEDSHAEINLAGQDVRSLGLEPDADELRRSVCRASDRRDRRAGEPVHQHRRRQAE